MSDFADEETQKSLQKTTQRPKTRNIIRWNDEKLVIAFAEFRLAAQRHRIDIKKPLDDCAKAIAPFCTADALIQQLTKRRNRYLKGLENQVPQPASLIGTSAKAKTKRQKTLLKNDISLDGPSPNGDSNPHVSTPVSIRKSSRAKVKKEVGLDESETVQSLYGFEDSDSDYTDSLSKDRKKRVRGKKTKSHARDHGSDGPLVDETADEVSFMDDASSPVSTNNIKPIPFNDRANVRHERQYSFQKTATIDEVEDFSLENHGHTMVDGTDLTNQEKQSSLTQNTNPLASQNVLGDTNMPVNTMAYNLNAISQGLPALGGADMSSINPQQLNLAIQFLLMNNNPFPPSGLDDVGSVNPVSHEAFGKINGLNSPSLASGLGTTDCDNTTDMSMASTQSCNVTKSSSLARSNASLSCALKSSKKTGSFEIFSPEHGSSFNTRESSLSHKSPTFPDSSFNHTGFGSPEPMDGTWDHEAFGGFNGCLSVGHNGDEDEEETPRKKLTRKLSRFNMEP